MDAVRIYDPVFILRFSIHTLLMGYIEPVEFSRLGLLAITLVSISSPDEDLRKLGYESLGTFKKSLEVLNSCYLLNIDMIFCHTGLLNSNATGYCLLWQWQPYFDFLLLCYIATLPAKHVFVMLTH